MIRHAHSHIDFQTEDIPLCQVNQPRSDNRENIISINVPVIASTVDETKRTGDHKRPEKKRNLDDDITKLEESDFCKKDSKEKSYLSCLDESDKKSLGLYCPLSFYQRNSERSERKKEKCPESEPLFFVESGDVPEPEKPRRYNRSSLKKQKVRVYDDRDMDACKNVPIIEVRSQDSNQGQEAEPEKKPNPKVLKTVEMRRKAFLRKVSLQDTYLNYNQDYWLDFRKSGRFHKSIDLGYIGGEGPVPKPDPAKRTPEDWSPAPVEPSPPTISNQNSAITRQSKLPSPRGPVGRLRRSGSDPVIRSDKKHSCKNCGYVSRNESSELLTEAIAKCESGEKNSNWFCLPSNENIPLFSERNGRIETDFDVLDEEGFLSGRARGSEDDLPVPTDFSDFYEIKLTSESDGEPARKSTAFFDETLTSMSGDSDVFYETEPFRMSEEERRGFSSYLDRSSSSPPKPSPSYS